MIASSSVAFTYQSVSATVTSVSPSIAYVDGTKRNIYYISSENLLMRRSYQQMFASYVLCTVQFKCQHVVNLT